MKRLLFVTLALSLLATPALAQHQPPRGGSGGNGGHPQTHAAPPSQAHQSPSRPSGPSHVYTPQRPSGGNHAGSRQPVGPVAPYRGGQARQHPSYRGGYVPHVVPFGSYRHLDRLPGRFGEWNRFPHYRPYYGTSPFVWFLWGDVWYPYEYDITYAPTYEHAPLGYVRIADYPAQDEVYVDGTYCGIVDDFNSRNQSLPLEPGNHTVVIQDAGQSYQYEIQLAAGATLTIHWKN